MQFKEDSNTEKKIAAKLKSCLERSIFSESEEKLRRSLFDLIQASIWNGLSPSMLKVKQKLVLAWEGIL